MQQLGRADRRLFAGLGVVSAVYDNIFVVFDAPLKIGQVNLLGSGE